MTVHDFLGSLSPTTPSDFTAWLHIIALAMVGVVKVARGWVMQQRARRIDIFGWSIISFDYIFGGALLIGTLWAFYPQLHREWLDLTVTIALVVITFCQGLTVIAAPDLRINQSMASQGSVEEWPEVGERRSGQERRKGYVGE